jgi:diaminohydroxyphosphoribosylaminopyrimidine deaminase/5-amino-6-(5-phosphoribosylamino)uracil reductase
MTAEHYMQRCLMLAQQAKGHTAPNPMVGAVLVHNDRIIGEGWHHFYGADHAEVNCLKNVKVEDKHLVPDSTMYVTLEPCAHQGITPPCANRLVKEGIKKVVIANKDPFEQVSGRGVEILKAAGITVTTGILDNEAAWVNRRFFCFHRQKRPYIILKWAQSQDGIIAPADRSRMQITGAASNQLVHKWRTEEAAIMVGTTTAINDNPQLTARLWEGNHPLRIVLDRSLTIPLTHHIYDDTAATWIVNEQKEALEGNIHFTKHPFDETLLPWLMQRLHETKKLSLIVEGGAALLNSFIRHGLWDEARVFTGTSSIGNGIVASALQNEKEAFTKMIGEDRLNVFTNKNNPYSYPAGMEL